MNFFRLPVLALALTLALPATAEETAPATYQTLLTPLFKGNETIIGQKIAYPDGEPKVTAAIVTIAPGKDTGWHTHQVPLFVNILEGEISVDYGSKGVKVYKAGESFLEAMDWPHNATNKTDAVVRIMAVYIGADGKTDAAPSAGAQ
jgi:quercetin dioxygenase-like cupin family protein